MDNNKNIDTIKLNQILKHVKEFYKPEQLKSSKIFRNQFLSLLDRARTSFNLSYQDLQVDFNTINQLRKL